MQPKESATSSHFFLSIVKSCIRIWACVLLYYGDYKLSALLFACAEGVGIIEEF